MTVNPAYPGANVNELSSEVRTITGVATSITAFIGRTRRGPTDRPVLVQSFGEFTAIFGNLWDKSPLTYAVSHYFLNGGRDALICRIHRKTNAPDAPASAMLPTPSGVLILEAASYGLWGTRLSARVEKSAVSKPPNDERFDLLVKDRATGQLETFRNLSLTPSHPWFAKNVLEAESVLVRTKDPLPADLPELSGTKTPAPPDLFDDAATSAPFVNGGDDGGDITIAEILTAANLERDQRGLWLLDQADIVNIICVPPPARDHPGWDNNLWDPVANYAKKRRAVVLVDPPSGWATSQAALDGLKNVVSMTENGAIYFPRIKVVDPLQENRVDTFAPCGAVAGVIARTDATRGVWKAPAGLDATLLGVADFSCNLDEDKSGQLNPRGINCLRQFPSAGRVVWGARTLDGDDRVASEWKYLPVRRIALYIEESLFQGIQWVVFEPNDEPLWSQIRLNVGAFMHDLFRQGAFQGVTPKDAYFVKCDKETTTQSDVDGGVVNIVVGFAPLKPAEFVVIHLAQMAGQIAT